MEGTNKRAASLFLQKPAPVSLEAPKPHISGCCTFGMAASWAEVRKDILDQKSFVTTCFLVIPWHWKWCGEYFYGSSRTELTDPANHYIQGNIDYWPLGDREIHHPQCKGWSWVLSTFHSTTMVFFKVSFLRFHQVMTYQVPSKLWLKELCIVKIYLWIHCFVGISVCGQCSGNAEEALGPLELSFRWSWATR